MLIHACNPQPVSCSNLYGNFSLALNGFLLSNSDGMNIYGSSNPFILSAYHSYTIYNNFYLQNTAHIIFNCNCKASLLCFCNTNNFYIGLSLDVTLFCRNWGCSDFTLYSNLNPNQHLIHTLWNITCNISSSGPLSCRGLVLNLKNGQSCIYYNSRATSCTRFPAISKPTQSPTPDPTESPTVDPTTFNPTNYPTIAPTKSTNDPSINPTIEPTADPTKRPTQNIVSISGDEQFLGLGSIGQYTLIGGLIVMFILLIIAVTLCYILRMRRKENEKLVANPQHILAMSSSKDGNAFDDINGVNNTFPFLN